jgi:hypothetical protein
MTKQNCDGLTRRKALHAGLAVGIGAIAATAASVPAQAQSKIAQSMVQYQKEPKDGNHCAICAQFQPPNACQVVEGVIDPNGWCIAFAPKA